ncbi:MAG: histidinol dehydrogenase [Thermodesulfovibrionales bacterium]|nr:histidinol dehydrogenase [Thermodesulfovibrionales bacterium]
MKILKHKDEIESFIKRLEQRMLEPPEDIVNSVKIILDDVKRDGDRALLDYTRRFDRIELKTPLLSVKKIKEAAKKVERPVLRALEFSAKRIRRFHEKQKESSWSYREGGVLLGQIIRPLERVGVYVPGGRAAYPSTVLMNVIPAQVAGVKEIAVVTPTPDGIINPYVMAAIEMLGIKEVYQVGGAQSVGALAFGTETIKRVDKIVGPGNIYVALAKRMVFGIVDIDMIAGPSEVLIIADRSARPDFIAADLLSQAEHDENASSVVLTDSLLLAEKIKVEIDRQLKELKRKDIALTSLQRYGAIILTKNLKMAAELANSIAPEHLELMVKKPKELLPLIKNAGAIFMGSWTPEPLGDYVAGPNHTLPTGGTARFSSPLGVYDFIKRSSLIECTKNGFRRLAPYVEEIAEVEGLEAHARSISVRKNLKNRSEEDQIPCK